MDDVDGTQSNSNRRMSGHQIVLHALVAALIVGLLIAVFGLIRADSAKAPPTTVVTTTLAPAPTTTVDPYANLRASLNSYCAVKHLGHALITVRDGAPIGDCSG